MKDFLKLEELLKVKLDENGNPKKPVNIFSKEIDVRQTEEARRSRMKIIIIEALLFGAFLTSVTAIYFISGINLDLNPESKAKIPSLFLFFLEFLISSALIGYGDYRLTETRVNDYNQKAASNPASLSDEITNALKEQELEGITKEEAVALNRSDGEEIQPEPKIKTEVKEDENGEGMSFTASAEGKETGKMSCRKGLILDSAGMEHDILIISELSQSDEARGNDAAAALFDRAKSKAEEDGLCAAAASKELNDKFSLGLFEVSKYKLSSKEPLLICESYPGSLMGISGEIRTSEK